MVVNDPYGNFYCVDDSFGTVNPTIDFNNPAGGSYDIWIGSYAVNGPYLRDALPHREFGQSPVIEKIRGGRVPPYDTPTSGLRGISSSMGIVACLTSF